MKEIFEKLTTYNIFNYLLPGILFVVILRMVTGYDLVQKDMLLGVFLYYFIGLVISRIGSLIVEPLLKWIKFVKFAEYVDYAKAEKKDGKIGLLSEVNNTYRTITGLFVCLVGVMVYEKMVQRWVWIGKGSYWIGIGLLMVLFLFAYRKQTEYVRKRVKATQKED